MASQKAFHRSRPVRVVFLVEESPEYPAILDAIYGSCMSRWGGRFNLIIPCVDGEPIPGYGEWMLHYDPDIIYSYVKLSDEQIALLYERYDPSFLEQHEVMPGADKTRRHSYRPKLPFEALSSLSTIHLVKRRAYFDRPSIVKVIDQEHNEDHPELFNRNFGGYSDTYLHSPFPRSIWDFARALTLVPDKKANGRHGFSDQDETVSTFVELLERMVAEGATSLAQLSALHSPRLEVRGLEWGCSFSVVVGDGFLERVCFWNGRSLYSDSLDGSLVTLSVPDDVLDDADLINGLATLINRRNRVNGSGGGQPFVTLWSHSASQERLERLKQAMSGVDTWAGYSTKRIESLQDHVPQARKLSSSFFGLPSGGIGRAVRHWAETVFDGEELHLSPDLPDHIRLAPTELQGYCNGVWGVDLDIERETSVDVHNKRNRWRLPRRLSMTQAFLNGYEVTHNVGTFVPPRTSSKGMLIVYASARTVIPAIKIPDDRELIRWGLVVGNRMLRSAPTLSKRCMDLGPSTQGRYLTGVLGLFGRVDDAVVILLHSLWVELFEAMGASSKTTDTQIEGIGARLRNKFRGREAVELNDDRSLNALSKEVSKAARELRTGGGPLKWSQIEGKYEALQKVYWSAHLSDRADEEKAEYFEHGRTHFRRCVQELCSLGVLHQGFLWKCSKCFHRQWISIDTLSREIRCDVCSQIEPAPIDREWEFSLNAFLSTALREHGIQSLVWALGRVRYRYSESFFYLGPSDIYLDSYAEEGGTRDGDVDLICVRDGLVYFCEVKQSGRDAGDLDNFIKVVLRMRPDKAVLAVMSEPNKRIQKAFSNLCVALEGVDIEPVLITLEDDDLHSGPYFW